MCSVMRDIHDARRVPMVMEWVLFKATHYYSNQLTLEQWAFALGVPLLIRTVYFINLLKWMPLKTISFIFNTWPFSLPHAWCKLVISVLQLQSWVKVLLGIPVGSCERFNASVLQRQKWGTTHRNYWITVRPWDVVLSTCLAVYAGWLIDFYWTRPEDYSRVYRIRRTALYVFYFSLYIIPRCILVILDRVLTNHLTQLKAFRWQGQGSIASH